MAKTKAQNEQQDIANREVTLLQQFYGDKMSSFVMLLVFSAMVIVFLFFMITYIYTKEPEAKYFMSKADGQIFMTQPLTDRLYTDAQIKDWAAQAVIRAFDFNFVNYRYQIANSRSFFTETGYNIFIEQLKEMFIRNLTEGKFSAKLSLCDVASIDKSVNNVFKVDGVDRFLWLVTLPVYVEFKNKAQSYTIVAKVITKIQRMSDLDYLGGLAISDIRVVDAVTTSYAKYSELPVCLNG